MLMRISSGLGGSVRRFRPVRRTVAQSPGKNRNGASALNLNEGVIAARFSPPQGWYSAQQDTPWAGSRRPIDKGPTPSYLSGNSPVSVGLVRLRQHVSNGTCCRIIEWRMSLSAHLAGTGAARNEPDAGCVRTRSRPSAGGCATRRRDVKRIRHVWRCCPGCLAPRTTGASAPISRASTRSTRSRTRSAKLSDKALRARADEFKKQIADGTDLDDLLVPAFATVRDAAKRTLGQRHFDVQLVGGMILHEAVSLR